MLKPDSQNVPPTAQTADADPQRGSVWLKRASEAYLASTSYVDTNFRKQWEDGIRAFNGQHPADSKYSSPAYEKRSHLYRPKIRSVIRKNEAAAAAAFFSNMETVNIGAENESSKASLANADIMKALLHYRLNKSIPYFLFVCGGIQDAQVTGTVCGHIYWDYQGHKETKKVEPEEPQEETVDEEYPKQTNLPKGAFTMDGRESETPPEVPTEQKTIITTLVDKPCMDLIPVENIRIDPSANWMDPVNSSPYIIHLIPMYYMDIKKKMDAQEWIEVEDTKLRSAIAGTIDTTRTARQKDRDDPQGTDTRAYKEIDLIWVQRHIHRTPKGDVEFYCIDNVAMLTEARPLTETVFHGMRPYVLGTFILEAHRIMSSGVPQVGKGLADEANEIANQRIDNVKFALNKKWFAKRGKDVDVSGLTRNVPGGVVMMDDPANDVREISWPDVTSSAYEEQNRINLDMDELLGNFNPAALIANGGGNAPARNMALLNSATGSLVEYGIRTFVETFIQPCLRQLIKLEQYYETDRTVLALAGQKAKIYQRFGIDQVTDELLHQELTLQVSVGMGATDPAQKLQKFLTGMGAFANIMKNPIPGMNGVEVGKEIFSHLGYRDASRFFTVEDPQVAQLQGQLQEAGKKIQELEGKVKEKTTAQVVGLQKTRETNQTKKDIAVTQEHNANLRALATHIVSINDNKAGKGKRAV